jgi:hypothetical protein
MTSVNLCRDKDNNNIFKVFVDGQLKYTTEIEYLARMFEVYYTGIILTEEKLKEEKSRKEKLVKKIEKAPEKKSTVRR